MNLQVKHFIDSFHIGDNTVDYVFTNGCCYWFAQILCEAFNGKLVYDEVENHFASLINGRIYDITGDITNKYNMVLWDDIDDDYHKNRIIDSCVYFRKDTDK